MTDTGAAAWDIPTGTTCTCGTVVRIAARGEVIAECSFLADLKRFLGSLEGLKKVTYMYFIEVLWYNTIPGTLYQARPGSVKGTILTFDISNQPHTQENGLISIQ